MARISFVVFAQEEDEREAYSTLIERSTHGRLVGSAEHEIALKEALGQLRPDAILVGLGATPDSVLDLLDQIGSEGPAIFVCGPQNDSTILLRALKLGVKEFFPPHPNLPELDGAIEQLVLTGPGADRHQGEAPILAVMGAKGGVGATFVACQLAASLQRRSQRTVIVDLNCPLGDVALQFDIEPRYTLASVLNQKEQVDATFLENLLERHESGLAVLAAPVRVEENELVRGDHVEKVLSLLREDVDWVVVDVARSWNEASVRALDLASGILLVTSPDLAALAHTRQHLDLLKRLGHDDARIHLVANRHSNEDAVTRKDFEKFVGRSFDEKLPNDYFRAVEAVNRGRTLGDLAPRSELTLAFDRLAQEAHAWSGVATSQPAPDQARFGGRVRRLFRR